MNWSQPKKIHSGATRWKNIATNQYNVDLCDIIYISKISSMMIILKYFTFSNDIHHILRKAHNRVSPQPRVFVPILKWYEYYSHVNKCLDVEHGRNHLITSHWGIPLTSVMEITNDDNDSQGTFSTIQRMWINELKSNTHGIIQSEVNDVNLFSEVRRHTIEACRSQGTN